MQETPPTPPISSSTTPRMLQEMRDELNRKLAKLTDENWAKDLEIQHLRSLHAAEETVAMRLKAECALHQSQFDEVMARQSELEKLVADKDVELMAQNEESARVLREARQTLGREMESLKEANAAMKLQMSRLGSEHAALGIELERVKLDDEKKRSQAREEHDRQAKRIEEATEVIAALEREFEASSRELADAKEHAAQAQMQLQVLQEDFQKRLEVVLTENKKFRQMLDVRETQTETDRNNLKQWQEQLNFLDQHLRQSKDALRKDKAEVLRLARQLANELQQARNHPFKDHIEFAETELSKLQAQLNSTSPLSPARPKLEERLSQMSEQRDQLLAALAHAQSQLDERIQSMLSISRSASSPL